MIKHFTVKGLNGTLDHDLTFNPDLNIVTGKNGSGKTTLLKLLWYMVSPNVERTVPEIPFKSAVLHTDSFKLAIRRTQSNKRERVALEYTRDSGTPHTADLWADEFREPWGIEKVEAINRLMMQIPTGSVFFPTFRRIEGGFSLEPDRRLRGFEHRVGMPIGDAMAAYSQMMTVRQHKFVASISTSDIEDLLTRQYAEVSEQTNTLHTELSEFISTTIATERRTAHKPNAKGKRATPTQTLKSIEQKVVEIEKRRALLPESLAKLGKRRRRVRKALACNNPMGYCMSHEDTLPQTQDGLRV